VNSFPATYLKQAALVFCFFSACLAAAQDCPHNIDFERGNFNNWTCYTGTTAAVGNANEIYLSASPPTPNRHTMYSAATDAGVTDMYGGFPVLCPNGSGYSVKLGNNLGGTQAEGVSYTFTIPPDRNTYSLIYHYAVVFQDPAHLPHQQPRLELSVTNITDGEIITCSSFTFFPNGSPLPGFFQSPVSDSVPVWCKNWSAVTINLNGHAGKTIQLFFKTADCTFRRHFGYAYIDVNSECSSEFVGATYCPDDTAVVVTAPYGYQGYRWFNSDFSQVLGSSQTLSFNPPPPQGTLVAVELMPYDGYGCQDTLYAQLIDTLTLRANAGPDVVSCNGNAVILGENPKPGVVYSWSPSTGLSDPLIANPRAGPATTTPYYLTIRNSGGGCVNSDTVIVTASTIDSSMQMLGEPLFCINTGDSAVFLVQPEDTIQWYRNGSPITGANLRRYRAQQSGTYYARLKNSLGCMSDTRSEQITVEVPRPAQRYPVQYVLINDQHSLQARTFGSSVRWQPPTYLDDPAVLTPVFSAPRELEQLYTIQLTTQAGCVTVDTQLVKTIKDIKVYVPAGFTPNNDGLNDYLKPVLEGFKQLNYFRVYNRWGQLIYQTSSLSNRGWDGRLAGNAQQSSVFVWTLQGVGVNNKIYNRSGTVVLIR